MATKDELEIAIKVINEISGNPDSGVIADLIRDIKASTTPIPEKRVVESKETR
jgi:hypothetical protein